MRRSAEATLEAQLAAQTAKAAAAAAAAGTAGAEAAGVAGAGAAAEPVLPAATMKEAARLAAEAIAAQHTQSAGTAT
jgi:hypothetical protein